VFQELFRTNKDTLQQLRIQNLRCVEKLAEVGLQNFNKLTSLMILEVMEVVEKTELYEEFLN